MFRASLPMTHAVALALALGGCAAVPLAQLAAANIMPPSVLPGPQLPAPQPVSCQPGAGLPGSLSGCAASPSPAVAQGMMQPVPQAAGFARKVP